MFSTLALALLMAVPQGTLAQQAAADIEPVAYTWGKTMKNDGKTALPRLHRQRNGSVENQRRAGMLTSPYGQAPIQITSEKLRKAAKAKVPYVPDNNHKHLIVNVIYNSLDDTMDEGLFDLDVVTGELTFLTGNFIEDYENYGFNGGGYIWNGKYRGVFYDDEYGNIVSSSNQATIMEFDMET